MLVKHATPEIEESWERCIQQYKLDTGQPLLPPRLTDTEIRQARQEFDEAFHMAAPIFDRLVGAAEKSHQRIHTTDINGIVLQEFSDSDRSYRIRKEELDLGSVLKEEQVGTNGVGTCLATGDGITIYGKDHFNTAYQGLVCSCTPLISPFGEVAGTLSVSSHTGLGNSEHARMLKLANDAATEIEAAIFRSTFNRYHLLNLVHQSHRQSGQSNSMIAVNDSGWIVGVTSPALPLLGVSQRNELIGQSLASVLGYSLEDVYRSRRLLLQSEGWFISLESKTSSPAANRPSIKPKPQNSPLYQAAGSDSHLKRNADICHRVINKKINILLMGETGTGKEVWARAIHDSSDRSRNPFVTLNCAAIPESLIESELFGYSSGTFTGGLKKGKVGKIEASNGGTLFLDEIGDMPLTLQARLLRVLAEGEVTPLGQLEPVKIDLNVICATHRNLMDKVEDGSFREDLYYRISGVNLTLSALRERSDRIDVIKKVLDVVSNSDDVSIDEHAMAMLNKYHWPGNIRQLKNVLHFANSMRNGKKIRITDLPEEVFPVTSEQKMILPVNHFQPESGSVDDEREVILNALEEHRWVVLRAAEALGISRSTLHRKIKMYDLKA
ncbi:sigma-54-dependent Fis family transcriptional regulator [Vibrio sp. JC009]|uniref:sigma-54-dependent Fis family transcriptional regulator n=1 Tax=Vibrio sp. JC009 TaxID=2912314 RepID=UPI0023B1FED9|nr:sigma-54-dependent Fis family transcriptional regulator [Vibrio sp. JC009]WED23732.1 sigma-54-dependent Fis family transcriptional regulator [Vibrio sp. JC009]